MINTATLNEVAQDIANKFLGFFPDAELTSGVRSMQTQASAMASNCIINPKWISETYAKPLCEAAIAAQSAVDSVYGVIAGVVTQDNLTAAIIGALSPFSSEELRHLSWHLSGDAFDVQPVEGPEGDSMVACLDRLVTEHIATGGHGKFLSREGGEIRWHVQVC